MYLTIYWAKITFNSMKSLVEFFLRGSSSVFPQNYELRGFEYKKMSTGNTFLVFLTGCIFLLV